MKDTRTKQDNKNKVTVKSSMKQLLPWTYYILLAFIIAVIKYLIFPLIMKCVASGEVYSIPGTASQIVQNDRAIVKFIIPFSFAISIFFSALILISFLYIVNYFLYKKGFFAPHLDIACFSLTVAIALSAVYTLGYDASKEIYEINPKYFSGVFDVASGKNNPEKRSIGLETELTSSDETSEDKMTESEKNDQNASDNGPYPNETGEIETYDYVTEVNGYRKDWALRASEYNNVASLVFAYAAALLIPLNWYKDQASKSDKNIGKHI